MARPLHYITKQINIMITEKFSIDIAGVKVELELSATPHQWSVYCENDIIDYHGVVFNGHYSYNGKDVVMYMGDLSFKFFKDAIRRKISPILKKKNKYIKK